MRQNGCNVLMPSAVTAGKKFIKSFVSCGVDMKGDQVVSVSFIFSLHALLLMQTLLLIKCIKKHCVFECSHKAL